VARCRFFAKRRFDLPYDHKSASRPGRVRRIRQAGPLPLSLCRSSINALHATVMASNSEAPQYHIKMKKGDVGRFVLLPGDPARSQKIAEFFDDAKLVAQNREFTTYTGTLLGEKVTVCSTGIGCPSTAIAVEELIKIGADTFIRVGTSGGMQPGTKTGDVAVVTGAIRDEGTSRSYLPLEYPAVADPDVVFALRQAANDLDIPHKCGVTHSKDSFFGETEKERMPMNVELTRRWEQWVAGGAICSEMESATLFIISAIHRKRAGSVNIMVAKDQHLPDDPASKALFHGDRAIRIAVDGIKKLIELDRTAEGHTAKKPRK
jgi:uridine phosphorylase